MFSHLMTAFNLIGFTDDEHIIPCVWNGEDDAISLHVLECNTE